MYFREEEKVIILQALNKILMFDGLCASSNIQANK